MCCDPWGCKESDTTEQRWIRVYSYHDVVYNCEKQEILSVQTQNFFFNKENDYVTKTSCRTVLWICVQLFV